MYIPRRLQVGDRTYSEEQLLRVGSVFVVLAEPGAGKTELLGRLGLLLNVVPARASVFRARQISPSATPLVIDAMDEVARIDRLAMDDIVVRASEAHSDMVIFAGRSSEWEASSTAHVKDCFGVEPVIVRLQPFDEDEQRQLFEAKFLGESFDDFVKEAARFELVPLFGNPQFLQLFGEAYVESGHSLTSKRSIFADAVRRLTHEANKKVSQNGRPPVERLTDFAGEVFAKLLLSGASGVSTVEDLDAAEFPYLAGLIEGAPQEGKFLLDTRLLKPSAADGQHEPVHRIVAEYCAARYLIERIENPQDILSLKRVLAIAAPNDVSRPELRGMLGWMAALAGESTQIALAKLDPYAVFANGDPSQLTAKAKKALLKKLNEVSQNDPFFRRDDVWRQFNVGGFFTPDIQTDVASILGPGPASQSLRQLVLELLPSSDGASQFIAELRALVFDPTNHQGIRKSAQSALLGVANYHPVPDIAPFRAEGSAVSLELAAKIVRKVGVAAVGVPVVVDLLRQLGSLYPKRNYARDELSGSRYFVRTLVEIFDLATVTAALDGLTNNLVCTCKPKYDSLCECRIGVSKIAGFLLDRYFALGAMAEAGKLYGWIAKLRFRDYRSDNSSAAVAALSKEHDLRRKVQWLILTESPDPDEVRNKVGSLFSNSTHSGIRFHVEDMEALAQRAFEEDDLTVWGALWRGHNRHDTSSRSNPVRTLQRGHIGQKPAFMAEWCRRSKQMREIDAKDRFRIRSNRRRREEREAEIEEENRTHLLTHRAEIEAGKHGGWLQHFVQLYLLQPDEIEKNLDYGATPVIAIRNSLPLLTPLVPTLRDLGDGRGRHIAELLLAHCIVRFRDGTPLDGLPQSVLRAAATEMGSYPTFKEEAECEALAAEFDRLVFDVPGAVEEFAADFIEPALALTAESATPIHWLDDKAAFHRLRATLPLEWLEKYPRMPLQQARRLFQMAAEHGDRIRLGELIDLRFAEPVADSGKDSEDDKLVRTRHRFWALNVFFYSTSRLEDAWEELRQDKDTLLALEDRVGMFGFGEESKVPTFSAETIYRVMDDFVGKWPKVPLPSSYGSSSPRGERAYRFLDGLAWRLGNDMPSRKLPVLERMLADTRFADFRDKLLTVRAEAYRQLALQDFRAPSPSAVSAFLDDNKIASVEDLRALLVDLLGEMQVWLKGVETDPRATFYDGGKHVDENTGRNRVVDFLNGRMTALGLSVVIEHHMASGNRCDFTVSASIPGTRKLLVVEVKGQWNKELYTAASAQLQTRYSIHPDAAGQGVYLVFWFGDKGNSIAGKADPSITSAEKLKEALLATMSEELKAVIDVVVLDVSRAQATSKPVKPKTGTPKAARSKTGKSTTPTPRPRKSKTSGK